MIGLARRIGATVIGILDRLFPSPVDDTMAIAEAVGVAAPASLADDPRELQREYHVAMCTAVEPLAVARLEVVGLKDFTLWQLEVPSLGEPS